MHPIEDMIVALEEAVSRGVGEIGGKAQGLARLVAAGVRVPRGFVLTTAAAALYFAENGLDRDASPADVISGSMPEGLTSALEEVVRRLEGRPVAVRSSAPAEDLADGSYAGQYETVLDVDGAEAIADAVRRCWASAFGQRVTSYRARTDRLRCEMAVVIQEMVPAASAGVAFTVDPVTGADRIVIEAAEGLGDRLMAGEVVPEQWTVSAEDQIERSDSGSMVLSPAEVKAIAEQARQLAALTRSPQDVEWAIAGGAVWILQSRPITALPVAPEIDIPKAQTWLREDEYYPEPMKPLEFSVWFPLQSRIFTEVFAELGLPLHTIAQRRVGGRVYMRIVPVGDTGRDRPPPPAWVFGLLTRVVPELRKRMKTAAESAARDLPTRVIDDWESSGKGALRSRAMDLLHRDLTGFDDQALAEHIKDVMAHIEDAFRQHFRLVFPAVYVATGQLGAFLEAQLGWEPSKTLQLLQGYGHQDEADAVRALTDAIRGDTEARALIEDDPLALRAHGGTGGEALRRYLDRGGHRMVGVDLAQPTYAEDPRPLLAMVRQGLEGEPLPNPPSVDSKSREREARASLAERGRFEEFERLLERARRGHPYGEATEFDVGEAMALMRYAALEAARRLEGLPDPDAVHLLTVDELVDALGRGRTDIDITRRRGEHRWALANPGPRFYGPPPTAPPDLRHVPRASRPVIAGFAWSMRSLFPAPLDEDGYDGLRGLAASPGRATGAVRVITTPAEFDRVKHGDVLVCPSTMASWTVVFPLIAAVVTERGGPLSHPAILAREFGIPAVVSVPEATRRLREGEVVTVDGARGVVVGAQESSRRIERKTNDNNNT